MPHFLSEDIYNMDMWKFYKTLLQHYLRRLFFNFTTIFVGSVLPPWEKNKYPHPFKVDLPSLQTVRHGILQSLEFGVMLSPQAFI